MIETYVANTYLVADSHSRGLSIAEIDQIVKVDDLPAEGELNSFRNAVHNVLNDRKILAEYVALGLSVLTTGWIVFYIVFLGNHRNTLLLERFNLQNKNVELTRFAGVVAHDLQTPVATMMYIVDRLRQAADGSQEQNNELIYMLRQVSVEMQSQIKSLLEYALDGEKSIAKSSFIMRDLVLCVTENILDTEGHKHKIVVRNMPDFQSDPKLMERVWTNLITNAVKYVEPRSAADIMIQGWQENDKVHYTVEDKGIGIDLIQADTIFEPMSRLHGQGGLYDGHGIGLALVRSIVERHAGVVYLDTNYREGARFHIEFPLA